MISDVYLRLGVRSLLYRAAQDLSEAGGDSNLDAISVIGAIRPRPWSQGWNRVIV